MPDCSGCPGKETVKHKQVSVWMNWICSVCCHYRKHCANLESCFGAITKCASTVQTLVPCVHGLKLLVSLRGPCIRIRRPRTPTTACFVTSVLSGTTFTSTAWSSQTPLCTSTPTGCTTACCGLGLAVHWIRDVWHPLEHRLVTISWSTAVMDIIFLVINSKYKVS